MSSTEQYHFNQIKKILVHIKHEFCSQNNNYCVYCNRKNVKHSSAEHICRNCNGVGHTTSYCKRYKSKNEPYAISDSIYKKHECVQQTGSVCSLCINYIKRRYVYPQLHLEILQRKLLNSIYNYINQSNNDGMIEFREEIIKKLDFKQLVKYINRVSKKIHEIDELSEEYKYKSCNILLHELCESCEGYSCGSGICGRCLQGHCICYDLFYLQSQCVKQSKERENEKKIQDTNWYTKIIENAKSDTVIQNLVSRVKVEYMCNKCKKEGFIECEHLRDLQSIHLSEDSDMSKLLIPSTTF